MAAAAYSTDLLDFKTLEAATTLGEMTGYAATGAPALDTDYPIQGTQHASASMTKTGLGSIMADFGSNVTWTSGHSFFMWGVFTAPAAVDTYANGGLRFLLGSDITTNYKGWIVGGNDYGRYPYGGWQNFAVNPETTSDYTGGTLAGYRWAGIGINCIAAIGKGVPVGLDCIRYGRGQLAVINGDLANGYGTFDAMAAANDLSTARWGLFQNANGSYLWKGLMSLGTTATAVDFRDNNAIIFVDQTPKVLSTFNKIEINNAASRVDWTGVSVQALGTVSKGSFECIADADVNFNACTFTDMATFIFKPLSTILGSVFRRCGQVTIGGGTFTNSIFEASTDTTGAVVASSPSDISNMTYCDFNNNTKAIKITAAGTYAFSGHQFSGNTTQVDFTGTGTCTINPSNGCNVSQANCTASGGGTIVVNAIQLTFSFNVNPAITGYEWRIYTVSAQGSLVGATEIAGQETASSATQNGAYSYTYTSDTPIAVQIIANGYEESVTYYTLTNASSSVTINLTTEGNL